MVVQNINPHSKYDTAPMSVPPTRSYPFSSTTLFNINSLLKYLIPNLGVLSDVQEPNIDLLL